MPTTQRRPTPPVIQQLLAQPQRFGLFQSVRLLELWMRRQGQTDPLAERRLRFRNPMSLAFAPSEVASLVGVRHADASAEVAGFTTPAGETLDEVEITPAGFGLLGVGGALPIHYTELLQARESRPRDPDRDAARAFLDIFQHRATALFYQAWRKHRLHLQFEQNRRDRFLPWLLAVAGVGQGALRDRLQGHAGGVADDALAFYAGTLQRRPMSAAAMQRVLQQYLGVPVALESFVGRWFELPDEHRSHLGTNAMTLGGGAVLGGRVWQRDLRMRLTLGPLKRQALQRFLPGGPGALALQEWLRLMAGHSLEFEVRLSLQAEAVRGCRLGGADAPRLGWDSFLITRASPRDRDDAGYDLLALA